MLPRDTIYLAIRQAILTCEFQPGQELREQALAERYRASRSPVRDSLLRLEKEELVTVLPRQGYRVDPILMSDVADILSFRLLIEPASAMAAARGRSIVRLLIDRAICAWRRSFRACLGNTNVWFSSPGVASTTARQRIVLGQQATEAKSNEITAIPLLLKHLDLKGALRTGCAD
jgi:Bacterial regulatory proteins, gntR family